MKTTTKAKKILAFLLAFVMMLGVLPIGMVVTADQNLEDNESSYEYLIHEGFAYITGYTGSATELVI
jgi:hypothetical protein